MTDCPFCGAEIEDDSRFCDQCGNRLSRCPKCGKLRRGKFCPGCGCPTVPAGEAVAIQQPQPVAPEPPARPATDQAKARQMVCRALGVTLPLMPGAVIGRINGRYADRLGAFQYLSGTQARIDFDGSAWSITDLGSRNGTAVNGIPCAPTLPFRVGDIIRFSRSYDFLIE